MFHSEASYLNTGYATYGREVISRLIATGKYEVAEYSSYGTADDPRRKTIPWKNYANAPGRNDSEEAHKQYNSNGVNQFGAWRFERACLDFKPDAVISQRDSWMEAWIKQCPYRDIFSWMWASTVDGNPQSPEWLNQFASTDYFYTLSDWATDIVKEQGGDSVNHICSVSPCAANEFTPTPNKVAHRISMGVDPDWKIIGTVMRNQRRKLFPDLFEAFGEFIRAKPGRDNFYLYCHTSYPDNGWDLPQLMVKNGISSRVLFTYTCDNCKNLSIDKFSDSIKQCKHCKMFASKLSNVSSGATVEQLAKTYQLFDIYFQCANCLPPGQGIYTSNGWKNIEEITTKDVVLTHKNRWKPVLNTFIHKVNCPVLKFTTHSDVEELTVTEEHPLYILSADKYSFRKNRSFRQFLGDQDRAGREICPEFVEAKDVKVGDLIAYAIDTTEKEHTIDLTDYIGDNYIIEGDTYRYKCSNIGHPIKITVDNKFAKWLGLYVADGSSSINNTRADISITSNIKDLDNIELCKDVMSIFGNVSIYEYKDRKAVTIKVSNKIFATYLSEYCGKLEAKRLPEWALSLPNSKQKEILSGMFMGDGCYYEKRNTSTYATISQELSRQLKQICRRFNINYNHSIAIRKGNRKPQYRFEICGNVARGEIKQTRTNSRGFYNDGYFFYQIKAIEQSLYTGLVYNIEVEEDNSYLGRIGIMHNSEGCGIPTLEAASCGVPVMGTDYSAMSDTVRKVSGFPVPLKAKTLELETGCYRAIPDKDEIIAYWDLFFSLTDDEQLAMSVKTRESYEANYSWDKTVSRWMQSIDSCPTADWTKPIRQISIPEGDPPEFPHNKAFLDWAISTYLPHSNLINSYEANCMLRDLNFQSYKPNPCGYFYAESSYFERTNFVPFGRADVVRMLKHKAEIFNFWEKARVGQVKFEQEAWL